MELTRSNWVSERDKVKEAIFGCDFLALDFELTGIAGQRGKFHFLDTPEERFTKARLSALSYAVCQVGISAWKQNEGGRAYRVQSFNAYSMPGYFRLPAFPTAEGAADGPQFPKQGEAFPLSQMYDSSFTCAASSLSFLASSSFDFNKWVRESVWYCSRQTTQQWKTSLEEKRLQENQAVLVTSELESAGATAKQGNEVCALIKGWILAGPPGGGEEEYDPLILDGAEYGFRGKAADFCAALGRAADKAAGCSGGDGGPCFSARPCRAFGDAGGGEGTSGSGRVKLVNCKNQV